MSQSRMMHVKKLYEPCPVKENDEIFRNGVFHFNISRILEDIHSGKLVVDKEYIDINEWFKWHGHHSSLNEDHLSTVNIDSIIVQAEISPGIFSIIDGNHRMEKAFRLGNPSIYSYKLRREQLIPYFITEKGYQAFVEYWNSKL
ncbi:hypothetical protein [Bacillus niameyensis]|uniref:hypothetical protein n=1 Tax=Bacillus niameyensis TaxID=1522308 RepID=UPI0007843807|nr:hypothetical protein [Bacillus niameyensis]